MRHKAGQRPASSARQGHPTAIGRVALAAAACALTTAAVAGAGAPPAGAGPGKPPPTRHAVATATGEAAPAGAGAFRAIACAGTRDCWLAGSPATTTGSGAQPGAGTSALFATTDAGAHWHREVIATSQPADLLGISCGSTRDCMAVGTAAPTLASGSTTTTVPGGSSSPTTTAVPGAGGVVVTTADGGRTWRQVAPPEGATIVGAVTCEGTAACTVLATGPTGTWAASTADRGTTWARLGTLPAGFAGATHLACTVTTLCVAAGYVPGGPGQGAGAVAVSQDGGRTWAAASVPTTGLLHDAVCTGALRCLAGGTSATSTIGPAAGAGAILTTTGGSAWSAGSGPPGMANVLALACPTAQRCVAVGTAWTRTSPPVPVGSVATSSDGGRRWQGVTARYLGAALADLACVSATRCIAVGGESIVRITLTPARPPHRGRAKAGSTPG